MSAVAVNGAAAAGAWASAGAAATSAASPATAATFEIRQSISCIPSKCVIVLLAGADSHGALDIDYEDLAVADRAGVGGLLDGLDDAVGVVGGDDHLDPDFGHEVGFIFGTAIDFRVALLPAVTARLRDGEALDIDRPQRLPHLVELVRLDDCKHEFHSEAPHFQNDTPSDATTPAPAMLRPLGLKRDLLV